MAPPRVPPGAAWRTSHRPAKCTECGRGLPKGARYLRVRPPYAGRPACPWCAALRPDWLALAGGFDAIARYWPHGPPAADRRAEARAKLKRAGLTLVALALKLGCQPEALTMLLGGQGWSCRLWAGVLQAIGEAPVLEPRREAP